MSYQLLIQPEAATEIKQAFEWYEEQSPGLGAEFVRAVDASLSAIRRNPQSSPILYKQTRRALLRKFPYAIFYRLETDVVAVIACLHARRDPRQWKRRK